MSISGVNVFGPVSAASGLGIVCTPDCRLYRFEGSTDVRAMQDRFEVKHFQRRWTDVIARDPYYNGNVSRTSTDFEPRQGARSG